MSVAGSEEAGKAGAAGIPGVDAERALVEAPRDEHDTRMGFGDGGFPLYVAAAWLGVIVAYVAYYLYFGVPDLRAWLGR